MAKLWPFIPRSSATSQSLLMMKSQPGDSVAAWDYDDVARAVSGDLVDVLGLEQDDPAPAAPQGPPPPGAALRRAGTAPAGGGLAGRIGVIIAAGFVGVAAGLALSHLTTAEVRAQAPAAFADSNG